MEIFLVVAYVFLFIFILRKAAFFKTEGLPTYFPAAIFVLKVFSGCALGLVYTYYYTDQTTTDTFKFFKDSGILFESMKHHPSDFLRMLTGIGADAPELRPYYEKMNTWLNTDVLFNDNKTVVRINTLFRFFSLGHYYVHVVFVNVISFIGFFNL